MKAKNISIFLIILLFTGTGLLGFSQAVEGCDNCDNPVDNSCIKIGDYVVSPSPRGGEWPIVCDEDDLTIPGQEGACKLAGQTEPYLDWRWQVCLPGNTNCKSKNTEAPTWSYFLQVIDLAIVPKILGSDPTGARLILPGDPNNCGLTVADEDSVIWKLNPAVTCEKASADGGVQFSMYTQLGVLTSICNMSAALYQGSCDGNYLVGPDADGTLPVEEERDFCYSSTWGGPTIHVTIDRCSGEPTYVGIKGVQATPSITAQICRDGADDCHPLQACGAGVGGCYICTDNPIYIYGDTVYYVP